MMRTYYTMLIEQGGRDTVGKMKQFATYFTHGVRNGARLRADIYHAREPQQIPDSSTTSSSANSSSRNRASSELAGPSR